MGMMIKHSYLLLVVLVVAVVAASAAVGLMPQRAGAAEDFESTVTEGKIIAFTRKGESGVGNCLACHAIAGGESPGNMGPPLVNVKQRFPNRADLKARLFDPTVFNPISAMPPFGKHLILTDEEIEKVMDFLYTL